MFKNKLISIDDFYKNNCINKRMYDYAKSICHGSKPDTIPLLNISVVHTCGFIKWDDNPFSWAGAWGDDGNDHVLISLTDMKHFSPPSKIICEAKYRHFADTSRFNFPYRLQDRFDMSIKCVDGNLCARSHLTYEEIELLKKEMTKSEYDEWVNQCNANYKNMCYELDAVPTYERPYQIHMTGTDDTSYGLTFASLREANATLQSILILPTWDNILNNIGFIFTN